ncbi:hypothetical protein KJ641_01970 [Patescibacteria group bacterium]|nr:hypothetical protein [Patescibacteria group bacterium]MBU1895615.1 hypothetical protein [Patescibacteria group bacterium]
MNLHKLSKKEKEELYNKSTNDLQRYWGNPIDEILDLSNLSDDDLEKGIKNNMGQLRFEKIISPIGKIIKYSFITFVALGIIGLLIFGIKQLF